MQELFEVAEISNPSAADRGSDDDGEENPFRD